MLANRCFRRKIIATRLMNSAVTSIGISLRGSCIRAAGDRRDQHDLVALLEGVGVAAEEADVFVVDVNVDEPAELALLVLDLVAERGEGLVDIISRLGRLVAVESNCFCPSV